ncbi:uncharacterized protein QC763_507695 [Podospora pseudopauciseta]|uniref:Uncharacterized protein n=1 Tax=Podospora pseudopauciseta TaxID=2093780 RepID=A0ABR0HAB0_9PEZI|nr:hypothetical protein QC763_507695 [Podospora pseudopauciseta]
MTPLPYVAAQEPGCHRLTECWLPVVGKHHIERRRHRTVSSLHSAPKCSFLLQPSTPGRHSSPIVSRHHFSVYIIQVVCLSNSSPISVISSIMKFATVGLLSFAQSIVLGSPSPSSYPVRRDVDLQWTVQAFPNGPFIHVNGTIEQVYSHVLKINPSFDKEFVPGHLPDEDPWSPPLQAPF